MATAGDGRRGFWSRLGRGTIDLLRRLEARWAGQHFEVRVWNAIDPKDPQPVTLFVGDPTNLKDSLLALSGALYGELDRGQGLELYSGSGMRVTDWTPPMLFLFGIRNATLHQGRHRSQTLRFTARLAFAGLLVFLLSRYVVEPPSLADGPPPLATDPVAPTLTTLRSRCAGDVACDVDELERLGLIDAGFLDAVAAMDGLVIPGFATGQTEVPVPFQPVLASLFRLGGGERCQEVLLLGRASASGDRAPNLRLAAERAAAVRARLEAAAPGERTYVTLVTWQHERLRLEPLRVRRELLTAGVGHPADDATFARFIDRSVQVICLP